MCKVQVVVLRGKGRAEGGVQCMWLSTGVGGEQREV